MNTSEREIKKFKSWLDTGDPYQRAIGIAVALYMGFTDVDEKIIHILRTDNVDAIRRDAMRMIVERKNPKFVDILIEKLSDDDWMIPGLAIQGLKKINPELLKRTEVKEFIDKSTHPFILFCISA